MKYSNRWKGMKKSTKIGLAISTAYVAANLAIPVFANQAEKQIIDPINIEQITTTEQAENLYKEQLSEYAQDKKINPQEIRNLYSIIKKGRDIDKISEVEQKLKMQYDELTQQIIFLGSEKENLLTPIKKIDKKISQGNEELTRIEEEAKNAQKFSEYENNLENLRKGLDKLINEYYPGLIEDKKSEYNLQYNSGDRLIKAAEESLYPLLRETIDIFGKIEHPKSQEVQYLWHKGLTIHEMVHFRKLLGSIEDLKATLKNYSELKKEQSDLIQQLEQEKSLIKEKLNPQLKTLEEEITAREQRLSELKQKKNGHIVFSSQKLALFEDYIKALEKREEFVKKYTDSNKYWSISVTLKSKFEGGSNNKEYNFENKVASLENLLKNGEGLDVRVENITNPTSVKLDPVITVFGGVMFSLLRNIILANCIIRRDPDVFDYLAEPFLTTMLGLFLLDGLHPLIYPIRLVAIPFIMEPIRALTGWRNT